VKDRLTDLGYAAGWRVVRALPRPVAEAVFNAAADRAARGNGPGAQRLRRNLRQVVGPEMPEPALDELVRQGLRSYGRYWMEAFRLPSMSKQRIIDTFAFPGQGEFRAAMADGRGVVLALPHMANWDLAGAWAAANELPLITVAERLKPESLFDRFVAYREKLGMEVVPLTGGQKPPLDVMADRLAQGWAVALLADRDLAARGGEVTFFGARTRMPPGPALLAIRSGAPLFAVDLWFSPGKTNAALRRIELPDPADADLATRVKLVTQRLADAFAIGIAEHPQDWHMLQKMWLGTPPKGSGSSAPSVGPGAGSTASV
jgi:KDO2-lipid IV(A) lauroyltransferase